MTVKQLMNDMYNAMKARDALKKDTLSAILAAVQKTAIDRKCKDNITEALVDEVILKELKTVKEMIDTCPADREETKAKYIGRYNTLVPYAPQQLTEKEIETELLAWAANENIELTKINKAAVMRGFMPTIKGRADGKLANQVIMKILE